MKRALLLTLGCKLNQAETAQLAARLAQNGVELIGTSDGGEKVDLVFINTCAVTARAEAKSRHLLAKVARQYPEAVVIAAGCASKYNPTIKLNWLNIQFLNAVGGIDNWLNSDLNKQFNDLIGSDKNHFEQVSYKSTSYHRARPLVKIQDGCDHFCSFCIIPHLRGSTMRSQPIDEILTEARCLTDNGFEEINLTGVRIGAWGKDLTPRQTLFDLCQALIKIPQLRRIRLGSIEPWELDARLLELTVEGDKVAPHLHIPLQHTSAPVLKAMHRPVVEDELILLKSIRKRNPNLALGIDVIAGFPAETEADFERLFNDLKNLPITYLHVFGFSARRGTPAYTQVNQNSARIIKERARKLRELGAAKRAMFYNSQIGRTVWAVPDSATASRAWTTAVSENYLKLKMHCSKTLKGRALKCEVSYENGNYIGVIK
ncbi:MAG: MiaB/RimO family radical SAM methylthiotransferase [Calditrichaeota bacterium]|nr:MiaB/RimO family radical SAM methylthiotransferase [Calditrichota bacterium]